MTEYNKGPCSVCGDTDWRVAWRDTVSNRLYYLCAEHRNLRDAPFGVRADDITMPRECALYDALVVERIGHALECIAREKVETEQAKLRARTCEMCEHWSERDASANGWGWCNYNGSPKARSWHCADWRNEDASKIPYKLKVYEDIGTIDHPAFRCPAESALATATARAERAEGLAVDMHDHHHHWHSWLQQKPIYESVNSEDEMVRWRLREPRITPEQRAQVEAMRAARKRP